MIVNSKIAAALAAFSCAALLAGCAMQPRAPARPALTDAEWARTKPIECTPPDECAQMWSRAQGWIVEHSTWKIQNVTDALIQTYGQGSGSRLAFTVTKIATGPKYRITVDPSCGEGLYCDFDIERIKIDFYDYVRGASPG